MLFGMSQDFLMRCTLRQILGHQGKSIKQVNTNCTLG